MADITSRKILFDIQAQTLELRKSTADVKELTKELKYAQVGEQKRRDELQQNIKYENQRREALQRSIIELRNEQQALNASNISNIKLTQTLRLYSRSITAAVPGMEKLTTSVLAFNYAITTGAGTIGILIGALTVITTVGRLLYEQFEKHIPLWRDLTKEWETFREKIKDTDALKNLSTEFEKARIEAQLFYEQIAKPIAGFGQNLPGNLSDILDIMAQLDLGYRDLNRWMKSNSAVALDNDKAFNQLQEATGLTTAQILQLTPALIA